MKKKQFINLIRDITYAEMHQARMGKFYSTYHKQEVKAVRTLAKAFGVTLYDRDLEEMITI